jgi:glycosyltransferase involved in cell wall biosynthesis
MVQGSAIMKIGVLSYDYPPYIGGQGRAIGALVAALRTIATVVVFAPVTQGAELNFARLSWMKRVPYGQFLLSIYANIFIRRFTREHQITHWVVNGGPGGALLIRSPGVPVLTIANHTYAQTRYYMGNAWFYALLCYLERRAYHISSHCIAISDATKSSLLRSYDCTNAQVTTLRYPAPPSSAHSSGLIRNPHALLFVGRLESRKGVAHLMPLFMEVMQRSAEATLTIIGEGSFAAQLRSELAASDLLRARITICGRVSDEELHRAYHTHGVLIMPSRFEGLGLVALEALAAGMAVVGSDTDGLREVLSSHPRGALCAYPESVREYSVWVEAIAAAASKISSAKTTSDDNQDAWRDLAERFNARLNKLNIA